MNIQLFIITIVVMQLVGFVIGKWASKDTKDHKDYFLASRSVTFFPLMMTFVATQVGGGLILGSADEAFTSGWNTLMYPLGLSIGLFLLGVGCGRRIMRHNVATLAQIFESFFGSSTLKKVASGLSIGSLSMALVAQILASYKLMVAFGISNPALFVLIWGGIIFYTTMGGLKAVIATDVLQAGFFFIAFIVCFVYAFCYAELPTLSNIEMPEHTLFSLDTISNYLLMPLIFMIIGQDMGQRCFAAKSSKTLLFATVGASAIVAVLGVILITFGVWAKGLQLSLDPNSSVLMEIVSKLTNPNLTALLGASIIAAIVSTADSLISAISSNLSQDFLPNLKTHIGATKLTTAGIAIGALVFSFFFNSVVGLLIQGYELSVYCLTVPLIASLFDSKRGHVLSASLAMGFGVVGFIFTRFYGTPFSKEIFCLLISLIGFGVGEILYARNRAVPILEN